MQHTLCSRWKTIFGNDCRKKTRVFRVCRTTQCLSKNVVSRILLNLLRVFHCLVASVLVTSEQNQVPDQIASGLEILKIRKTIFVILVFVGKNMFDIVSVFLVAYGRRILQSATDCPSARSHRK